MRPTKIKINGKEVAAQPPIYPVKNLRKDPRIAEVTVGPGGLGRAIYTIIWNPPKKLPQRYLDQEIKQPRHVSRVVQLAVPAGTTERQLMKAVSQAYRKSIALQARLSRQKENVSA